MTLKASKQTSSETECRCHQSPVVNDTIKMQNISVHRLVCISRVDFYTISSLLFSTRVYFGHELFIFLISNID